MKRTIPIVFVVVVVAIVVAEGMSRTPPKTTNASDIQFVEVVHRWLNEATTPPGLSYPQKPEQNSSGFDLCLLTTSYRATRYPPCLALAT